MNWARRCTTGLSSLRDRAAARLAGSRFNPSRSATISLRTYTDMIGTVHEVTAAFDTRAEAEAFFEYLDRMGL